MKEIYLHINKKTGEPFYVGKGSKYRTYDTHNRSIEWNKLVNLDGFDVIILENNLLNDEADKLEIYWINRIGRIIDGGKLINKTKGGKGKLGNYLECDYKIGFHKSSKNYYVRVQKNGKRTWCGSFIDKDEAKKYIEQQKKIK